jgi:hypothetical protein
MSILGMGGLALAACESVPTDIEAPMTNAQFSGAAAERTVDESLYDLTGVYFAFSCSAEGESLPDHEGELVLMEGQIYERMTLLQDAVGEYHYTLHTMPVGLRGIGVTSGEEFRVIERDHAVANQRLAAGNGSYRQELKMVGRETRRTFWMVASGFYRISANGDVLVERDTLRTECKPTRGKQA